MGHHTTHCIVSNALAALVCLAGCGEAVRATEPDGGAEDGALGWDEGGEDVPEYSLGRLLVHDEEDDALVVVDLDAASVAGRIEALDPRRMHPGASGRYSYVWSGAREAIAIVDPGQWLLSHIDHFHVTESQIRVLDEELAIEQLGWLGANEGWVSAFDAASARAFFVQERTLTAQRFAPEALPCGVPHDGVAMISHAHLVASVLTEGEQAARLTVRPLAESDALSEPARCTAPVELRGREGSVYAACAEGIVQLAYDAATRAFTGTLRASAEGATGFERLATTERLAGVIVQQGARTLWLITDDGAAPRQLTLTADIAAFDVRRNAQAALVLTRDGSLVELLLPDFTRGRVRKVVDVGADPWRSDLTLSHAYAYVSDPSSGQVAIVRLRTMEEEGRLTLGGAPSDVEVVGLPFQYTDVRE